MLPSSNTHTKHTKHTKSELILYNAVCLEERAALKLVKLKACEVSAAAMVKYSCSILHGFT